MNVRFQSKQREIAAGVFTVRHAFAKDLRERGLTYAEIGYQLGISRQRVQQMLKPDRAIYEVVKSRASAECEDCHVPIANGQLHHVDGRKAEGYNDPENLAYLCLACHRLRHGHDEIGLAAYKRMVKGARTGGQKRRSIANKKPQK